MAEFKNGDQVKFKSGGPVMTVTHSYKNLSDITEYTCEWWDEGKKEYKAQGFIGDALVLHDNAADAPLGIYKSGV